jgi:hypothetical protein
MRIANQRKPVPGFQSTADVDVALPTDEPTPDADPAPQDAPPEPSVQDAPSLEVGSDDQASTSQEAVVLPQDDADAPPTPDVGGEDFAAEIAKLTEIVTDLGMKVDKLSSPSHPPDVAPTPPGDADAVATIKLDLGNPGEVEVMADGPHAHKLLRPKLDETPDEFRNRFGLTDVQWDFWKQKQRPYLVKEGKVPPSFG